MDMQENMALIDQPTQQMLTPAAYFWFADPVLTHASELDISTRTRKTYLNWILNDRLQTRSNTLHLRIAWPAGILYENERNEKLPALVCKK